MKVVWTGRAKARLRKVHADIAEHNPKAADDLVRRLVTPSLQRQTAACSGRKVPEYDRDSNGTAFRTCRFNLRFPTSSLRERTAGRAKGLSVSAP